MTPAKLKSAASPSSTSSSAAKADHRKWTVMVFMGAATIEGNVPLFDAARADIAEMSFVGSGENLDIFVQAHLGKDEIPKRSHLGFSPKEMEDVPEGERDPSCGRALEAFIRWSLKTTGYNLEHPENRNTLLVLWGHAYDFAFGRERTRSGAIDALDFAELSDVLQHLQEEFGANKLDILGFDACDLATVEMACQLQPFANYLLGSEIGIPIPGWPYDRILDRLKYPYPDTTGLMGPAEFGTYIVRRFCESYDASSPVSLSLLDLQRASALFARCEVLAATLENAIEDPDAGDRIADLFLRSQTAEGKPFVDVADLCVSLVRDGGDALVIEAARQLGDFLISPQPPLVGGSFKGDRRPFVLEHGRNAGSTARLNGISIYAPHVALSDETEEAQQLYLKFDFAQDTRWSKLVHTLANLS